jgi:hypothetical protein
LLCANNRAKAEIEVTFQQFAERRLQFAESERQRLDELTSKMRDAQRKTIVNRAVRATNSSAHPLRNIGREAVR